MLSLDIPAPRQRPPCCWPASPRAARTFGPWGCGGGGRFPGCARTCRWRSGCWAEQLGPITRPGPPAGLAADLATAPGPAGLMAAENLSVAAAFDLSYRDLTAGQRRLFPAAYGQHPGPDIDAYAAAALAGTGLATARRGLEAPVRPAPDHRARPRPLPACTPASASTPVPWPPPTTPPTRDAATSRLLDYYLHTAQAAGRLPCGTMVYRRKPPTAARPTRPPARRRYPRHCRRPRLAGEPSAPTCMPPPGTPPPADGLLHAMLIPAAIPGFLDARGPLGSEPGPCSRPRSPPPARPATGPARPALCSSAEPHTKQ